MITKGKNPKCQSSQTLRLYHARKFEVSNVFKPLVLHDMNLVLLYVRVVVVVLLQ
jgi:hypothetical protein